MNNLGLWVCGLLEQSLDGTCSICSTALIPVYWSLQVYGGNVANPNRPGNTTLTPLSALALPTLAPLATLPNDTTLSPNDTLLPADFGNFTLQPLPGLLPAVGANMTDMGDMNTTRDSFSDAFTNFTTGLVPAVVVSNNSATPVVDASSPTLAPAAATGAAPPQRSSATSLWSSSLMYMVAAAVSGAVMLV